MPDRYEEDARRLLRMLANGDEGARRRVRAHVPRFAALDDAAVRDFLRSLGSRPAVWGA
jgi:hypothetical protein